MDYLFFFKVHLKIFHRHPQKAEALAFFFSRMFMMLFVSAPNRQKIWILGIAEYFYSLMDKNVMDKKVGHPIQGNAQCNIEPMVKALDRPVIHKDNGREGEYDKKIVIFFHRAVIAVVMMVFMEGPKESMHNIFMDHPRQAFHYEKSDYYN
jgi:hypothetical protein